MIVIYIILGLFLAFAVANALLSRKNTEYGITFVAGQIGSGKSTYAAREAQRHLKRGWKVYSTDYIKGCMKLDIADLKEKCCQPHSLLIIDEASLKMNSRDFAKTKLDMIAYFKLSRHWKNKIILISQTFTDTDKQVRDLSTKIFFMRKVLNGIISMPVRVKGDIAIGQDGQPTMTYRVGHIGAFLFLPRYYKYFSSFGDVSRPIISSDFWDGSAPEKPAGVAGAAETVALLSDKEN